MNISKLVKALLYPFLFLSTTITKWFWPAYPDDNPVEEIAEHIIKIETGLEVDLTPESPEVNNGSTE